MVRGELPNVIPDTVADPRVRELPVTLEHRIGSYIAVPVPLANGSIFGSFGCLSHEPTRLGERATFTSFSSSARWWARPSRRFATDDEERVRIGQLIERADFQIVLQPIFDIRNGRCLGVEALSRFPADCGGPEKVFAAAHRAGLGLPLERLALRRAVRLLSTLATDQFLSVNLTPSVAYALAASKNEHASTNPAWFWKSPSMPQWQVMPS